MHSVDCRARLTDMEMSEGDITKESLTWSGLDEWENWKKLRTL